jgi:two-component system sensor kinase FixL
MLTCNAALAATEAAVDQPAGVGPTHRDCASFALYPDSRISSWNQQAERMLGYSEEQALGRYFAWFFPVDEVLRGESERVLRIAGENGFHQWQGAWLRKDHSLCRAWVGMLAVRHSSGKLQRYTVITRDLTHEGS